MKCTCFMTRDTITVNPECDRHGKESHIVEIMNLKDKIAELRKENETLKSDISQMIMGIK